MVCYYSIMLIMNILINNYKLKSSRGSEILNENVCTVFLTRLCAAVYIIKLYKYIILY